MLQHVTMMGLPPFTFYDRIMQRFIGPIFGILAIKFMCIYFDQFSISAVTYTILMITERKLAETTRMITESSEYFSSLPKYIFPSCIALMVVSFAVFYMLKKTPVDDTVISNYLYSLSISNTIFIFALSLKCGIILFNVVTYQMERRGFYGLYQRFFVIIRFIAVFPHWYNYFSSVAFSKGFLVEFLVLKVTVLIWLVYEFIISWEKYIFNKKCVVRRVKLDEIPEAQNTCIICMGQLTEPVSLQCNHIFCFKCVERWMKNHTTCPFCRNETVKHQHIEFSDGYLPSCIFLFPF